MLAARPERRAHWDEVYRTREPSEVSWFQRQPSTSVELLLRDGVPTSVIDIGAGDSTLVDHLLDAGVHGVTLLDVSAEALQRAWNRVGRDERVHLIEADITRWQPSRRFQAWHDRATLHFLADPAELAAYARAAAAAVEPRGRAVIGAFGADGPDSCSGLPVTRYTSAELAAVFAPDFELDHTTDEIHRTPSGVEQHFVWVVLTRR